MPNYEKVIRGLEYCIESASGACPDKCPYKKECISRDYMYVPMRDALELLKEQQETIELQGSLLTLAHAAMSHGKKEGLTNGARPGRNREDPASHS